MAFTIAELLNSRDRTADRITFRYIAVGEDTDTNDGALAAVIAVAPPTSDGFPLDDYRVESLGNWTYRVELEYSFTAPGAVGEGRSSFDTAGGTIHLQASLATVGTYSATGAPTPAPDHGNLIGVHENGVDGVDVPVGALKEQETVFMADASVTSSFRATLAQLTGTVNNASFRGYAAGEVMFLGATGSKRQYDSVWEVTYNFAISPNLTGITIGDISGIAKKGHEHLWVAFSAADDGTRLVKKPQYAYVERVSREGNFSLLGI